MMRGRADERSGLEEESKRAPSSRAFHEGQEGRKVEMEREIQRETGRAGLARGRRSKRGDARLQGRGRCRGGVTRIGL